MAMTDDQRRSYEANGFLTIPGALAGGELKVVTAAAERAEARWRQDTTLPGARSAVLEQVQCPIEYDDALLALLWHRAVLPLVHAVLGDDLQMIDNDFFITPPHTPKTHAGWHHDVDLPGVYHPRSTMMVKVFYLLSDVGPDSGGTVMVPGSHRFTSEVPLPTGDPEVSPSVVQMTGRAGDAYLFNGRVWHAASNNESDRPRRVLIYNYGHFWMKQWDGYAPSAAVRAKATTPLQKQLLGIGDAYATTLRGATWP